MVKILTYEEECEEYDDIVNEAYNRFRKATSGVRGQTVTVYDGLDYWIYKVTKERFNGLGK